MSAISDVVEVASAAVLMLSATDVLVAASSDVAKNAPVEVLVLVLSVADVVMSASSDEVEDSGTGDTVTVDAAPDVVKVRNPVEATVGVELAAMLIPDQVSGLTVDVVIVVSACRTPRSRKNPISRASANEAADAKESAK